MIYSFFHEGSGLGNQLHRYVATRYLAEEKGLEWGMWGNFKGASFMNLHLGKEVDQHMEYTQWREKKVVESGIDIRSYDPEINFIEDWTAIDGEFQDERYWDSGFGIASKISDWLSVLQRFVSEDTCIIGFRGGEYYSNPDLGLPKEYYEKAIAMMKEINPTMRFEVHTDDEAMAKAWFPNYTVIHDIGDNWRAVRWTKYAIIANSSFYILPRLIRHHDMKALTIAPRYWARHNTKVWALPQNYYEAFTYI